MLPSGMTSMAMGRCSAPGAPAACSSNQGGPEGGAAARSMGGWWPGAQLKSDGVSCETGKLALMRRRRSSSQTRRRCASRMARPPQHRGAMSVACKGQPVGQASTIGGPPASRSNTSRPAPWPGVVGSASKAATRCWSWVTARPLSTWGAGDTAASLGAKSPSGAELPGAPDAMDAPGDAGGQKRPRAPDPADLTSMASPCSTMA